MSEIHDAIMKAAVESGDGISPQLAEAEQVLNSRSGGIQAPGRDVHDLKRWSTQAPAARLVEWKPNDERMLFAARPSDKNRYAREQFRTLRMQLGELHTSSAANVIAVGSAVTGEGKTFVTANLAHAFAVSGEHRVLVIDCDLRRGRIAAMLGAQNAPGLSDYLRGKVNVSDILQTGTDGKLYMIASGQVTQEPGELLGGSRFAELLAHLRSCFDWIFIDTPPAEYFSDAGVISGFCDGVLLVIAASRTPVRYAKRLSTRFRRTMILGVVLNRMPQPTDLSGYYEYLGQLEDPV